MKAWNRESRELKLRYREKREETIRHFRELLADIHYDLVTANNELSCLRQAICRPDVDLEIIKNRLDDVTERLRTLGHHKANLAFELNTDLIDLERQRNAELDALEEKYSVELDAEGKEVAV